ncbi:hypothetical protein [Phthorimaea operculella granulovirus]|uniref:Uncharacterized protein n=1 Tax=Phthorimaea operculella granulovirus TaxID=192584 RepID=Q8JS21_9BBAC|nr:hypothetical protein [Phthorimaea operculella granulovirus]AAM70236.1 hypothetical protein [Phthorimaea operculella granulovirus]ANY57427.1 hypothetical protein PhopGVgp038 [Phthorimaea operculella granulovirus]QBH65873.1 hypothetical protein PhopGVgp038 [Phthorimaea operculella granulovirus]QBH66003.1 hypothetical protein PhopGVgp038 [Phthorimaea operculella granulovirus]QBH66133.1 hypothetical protein PhopGVgp038 [Phthorimaea operculella granulovirus]
MNTVFAQKDLFMILAKQLNKKDTATMKPYLDQVYFKIQIYCVTGQDRDLRSLLQLLRDCNRLMKNMLIKSGINNNNNLWSIFEEI